MKKNEPTQEYFPPHDPVEIRDSLRLPHDAPDAHVIDRLAVLVSFNEDERRKVKKLCNKLLNLISN